jgi:autophagy-related protein 33
MEASYEVLGSATAGSVSGGSVSDTHSDGGAADEADAAGAGAGAGTNGSAAVNGEEVRAAVETFLKRQIVRTVTTGMAFGMAIVGLWGDGLRSVPVWQETFVVV